MIDPQTGVLRFDRPALEIAPALTRTQFLASDLAGGAKTFTANEPHHSWKLAKTFTAGLQFLVILRFHLERLGSIELYADPEPGGSWSDWSEEKELQRKTKHDDWLEEAIGSQRKFSWGRVGSEYDPRSGSSSIIIEFYP